MPISRANGTTRSISLHRVYAVASPYRKDPSNKTESVGYLYYALFIACDDVSAMEIACF